MSADASDSVAARAGAPASPLIRALRGERAEPPTVWFDVPRWEAGEPIEARLDAELAATRTVEAVARLGMDAAALQTEPLAPAILAGASFEFGPGGAVLDAPIRSGSDVLWLRPLDPDRLEPVRRATALAVDALGDTPLIGTAIGPFALASLMVEGRASADDHRARTLMYADSQSWATLMNWCADIAGLSLRAQVLGGAAAVQLADPRLGSLSRHDHFKRVLPHTQRVLSHLRGLDVPVILTGQGTGDHLDHLARAGASAVGVDWRIPLDIAVERVGPDVPLLGNLDPALLGAPWRILEAHVLDVVERGRAAQSHILGVGGPIPPDTDDAILRRIAELVHGHD